MLYMDFMRRLEKLFFSSLMHSGLDYNRFGCFVFRHFVFSVFLLGPMWAELSWTVRPHISVTQSGFSKRLNNIFRDFNTLKQFYS